MLDKSNPGTGNRREASDKFVSRECSWFSVGQCIKCEYEVPRV